MNVVQMKNIHAGYGKKKVLEDATLEVREGEIVVLMGPNGSGKTTLTKVMLGFLKPWQGEVWLFGKLLSRDVFRYIGVVFEEPAIYNELSAIDNVKVFSDTYGGDPKWALEVVGLPDHVWKKPVATFSRGMKRKVELARAIVHKPKLLVLDEATNGLDPASRSEIHKILLEMRDNGTSIFFTSHYLEEAGKLADKVYFLKQGKIITGDELDISYHELYFRILHRSGNVERIPATVENFESLIEGLRRGDILSASMEGASLEDVFDILRGDAQ